MDLPEKWNGSIKKPAGIPAGYFNIALFYTVVILPLFLMATVKIFRQISLRLT
jgi:hypothetical protein